MLSRIIVFCLLISIGVTHLTAQQDRTEVQQVLKGVTLPMHSFDYKLDYTDKVKEISELGAEWIQVNIKFYQENIYSSRIVSDDGYEDYWIQFENILIAAKDENLKVSILPIILLSKPLGSNWRGLIEPYNMEKWFKYYNKLMGRIAALAEKHDIEMLTVGSELVHLQQFTSEWEDVIDKVRAIYGGKLNYAANWDAYSTLGFLDKLDYLGISGYFELTESPDPSEWSLRYSWRKLKREILNFQAEKNIPVIFTELGYPSQDGCNTHPWNYYASEVVDLEEQKACFEAFIAVWGEDEDFHGAFIYDWYDEGGNTDTGYTVKDKPAEQIIRQWFKQITN